jgi:hypothetical protein
VGLDGKTCVEEALKRLPDYEKKFAHGMYMDDVTFRVKGKFQEDGHINRHSATFIAFPYSDLRDIDLSTDDHKLKHVPRTLLQTMYRSYSTKKLDAKPLSDTVDFGDVKAVHVAQLWALIVKESKSGETRG